MTTAAPATPDDLRYESEYLEFLRFASVSADPAFAPQLKACADWLVQRFKTAGLSARLVPTAGHPAIIAQTPRKEGRRTVLFYGHYDVQPPDPLELWEHPPFEPFVDADGLCYARGAADNKGQIFSHLAGIEEALKEYGDDLPVNVIFLVEGEEEVGSAHLTPLMKEHRDELACDVIVISDSLILGPGKPTLVYGMRGLAGLEFTVTGPARDLHSGLYGGIVVNPATVVARLVASLHDEHWHVAVAGFYDGVKPVPADEKARWEKLPITEEIILGETGSPALDGEGGYDLLERRWTRPTLEINGIFGGYQGAGTKTVLPSKAGAKITCRLVPGQNPERVIKLIAGHLREHTPKGVTIEIQSGHGGEPVLMDPTGPDAQAAERSLREAFGAEPFIVRDGATIPVVADMKSVFGVEVLLLGLGMPDSRIHSPNETFPLANLRIGRKLHRSLLKELAKVK